MNKIEVVSFINDTNNVTLYLNGAQPIILPANKFRTAAIVEKLTPIIAKREIATIDLDDFTLEGEIEKKSGGLMRFVKIAGEALNSLFKRQEVKTKGSDVTSRSYAIDKPVQTTVAIVDGKEIPGVEFLEKHMEHAIATKNIVGLQRFMERIATVVDKRGHTVQELMRFMERGDLPIADDGSIIAYKVLNTHSEEKGRFVDCHSGKVSQAVGSHVSMDEKLVDPSRRTECSTGLHIARRGYLRNFHGNAIVLVKVAPEDVIAVPSNEPDKMRTAAYHVVAQLEKAAHDLLRSNMPMTSHEPSAQILANVIAGNHVGIHEYVVIHSAKGGDVKIAETLEKASAKEIVLTTTKAVSVDTDQGFVGITPRQVNERVKALREAAALGDMSVAISVEPTADPDPVPNAETVEALKDSSAGNVTRVETVDQIVPMKIQATDTEKRDAEVLALIAEGKTQKQAADISGVNHRTVRRIVARNKA